VFVSIVFLLAWFAFKKFIKAVVGIDDKGRSQSVRYHDQEQSIPQCCVNGQQPRITNNNNRQQCLCWVYVCVCFFFIPTTFPSAHISSWVRVFRQNSIPNVVVVSCCLLCFSPLGRIWFSSLLYLLPSLVDIFH
jgi:hypothetical protein